MKSKADIVIVGGGVIGCSIAYYLAKNGYQNIIVLEKNFLTSGSTGKCGGGIRVQFGSEINIKLAGESINQFEKLSKELNSDIGLIQSGYLLLSYDDFSSKQLKANVKLQRSLGYDVKLLTEIEAKQIVPRLDSSQINCASYYNRDGYVDPYKLTYSFADAAKSLGVEINLFTEVIGIKIAGKKIISVETTSGTIETSQVVNAAGAYSCDIARMVNVKIPTYNEKHEILLSEPLDKFIDTMLVDVTNGACVQQFPNGRVMIKVSSEGLKTYDTEPTSKFAERAIKAARRMIPTIDSLRFSGQWTGLYNLTPDGQPIFGDVDEIDGFFLAVGLSGAGLMMSPMTGKLVSEYIIDKTKSHSEIKKLSYKRFKHDDFKKESMII
jgi:sarcosine oxidase, subunit beta